MARQNLNNSFISSSGRVLKNKVQWLQQATGGSCILFLFLNMSFHKSVCPCCSVPDASSYDSDAVGLNLLMPCRCKLLWIGRNHLRFKDEVIFLLGAWLPKQTLHWTPPKKMQLPLKLHFPYLTPGRIFSCEVIFLIEYLPPTPWREHSFWVSGVNCLSPVHKVESKLQLSLLLLHFPLQASISSHIRRLQAITDVPARWTLYLALPNRFLTLGQG